MSAQQGGDSRRNSTSPGRDNISWDSSSLPSRSRTASAESSNDSGMHEIAVQLPPSVFTAEEFVQCGYHLSMLATVLSYIVGKNAPFTTPNNVHVPDTTIHASLAAISSFRQRIDAGEPSPLFKSAISYRAAIGAMCNTELALLNVMTRVLKQSTFPLLWQDAQNHLTAMQRAADSATTLPQLPPELQYLVTGPVAIVPTFLQVGDRFELDVPYKDVIRPLLASNDARVPRWFKNYLLILMRVQEEMILTKVRIVFAEQMSRALLLRFATDTMPDGLMSTTEDAAWVRANAVQLELSRVANVVLRSWNNRVLAVVNKGAPGADIRNHAEWFLSPDLVGLWLSARQLATRITGAGPFNLSPASVGGMRALGVMPTRASRNFDDGAVAVAPSAGITAAAARITSDEDIGAVQQLMSLNRASRAHRLASALPHGSTPAFERELANVTRAGSEAFWNDANIVTSSEFNTSPRQQRRRRSSSSSGGSSRERLPSRRQPAKRKRSNNSSRRSSSEEYLPPKRRVSTAQQRRRTNSAAATRGRTNTRQR